MANVAHATLTGSNLHEPKGIGVATNGQVYVANGAGTGIWTDISATSFVGQVADFATPVAPTGWLECDGTDVSKITFPALFSAMTIQQTATRGSGSPIVTLTTGNTSAMRPGYFVYGLVAGQFVAGTTILTVDTSLQFTMSAGASSGGTATIVVSPWFLNTNTIRLPNVSAAARYRRSRSSTVHMGVNQADDFKTHTHANSLATTSTGSGHNHPLTDPQHSHVLVTTTDILVNTNATRDLQGVAAGGNQLPSSLLYSQVYTGARSQANATGITVDASTGTHTHGISGSVDGPASGGTTETRPITLVLMTCVKT